MTTFIDTNILIYLTNPVEAHHAWAVEQLQLCKANGPAVISDIVYCEFSVGMKNQAEVDEVVQRFNLERIRGSDAALVRAGLAFKDYKKKDGPKTNVLPDFLIGAIAEVLDAPLLTANARDFVGYFPKLKVISP